jgi:hypothetical protein
MSVRGAPSLQLSDYMLTGTLIAPDDDELVIEYDSDNDPYQQDLDAWKEGKLIGS